MFSLADVPFEIYVTFPREFWRKPLHGSPTQGREIPEYTNWISPAYASSTNPHQWPQEAYDLVGDHYVVDLPGSSHATLTLEPALQESVMALLARHGIPYAAVVLLDSDTARVRIYASHVEAHDTIDVAG